MRPKERFWEIDFLRGLAVVMMVTFHFIFDVFYFLSIRIIKSNLFWFFFPRIIASIFILISGICLYISYQRSKRDMRKRYSKLFFKYFKRGLKIFSIGVFITIVTFIFLRQDFIIFGILHFLGISSIVAYPFIRLEKLNLIFGILFILIGLFLSNISFNFSYLLFLGFIPRNFSTLDYFPIFPWFGFVLIGIFLASIFYKDGKRNFKIIDLSSNKIVKLFCILGRNSLKIYLIHQPIIISTILLFRVLL